MHLLSRRFWAGLLVVIVATLFSAFPASALRVGYINNEGNTAILTALQNVYESTHRGETVELVPLTARELQTNLPQWLVTGETADVYLLQDSIINALKSQDLFRSMLEFRWPGFQFDEAFSRFPAGVQLAFTGPRGPLGIPLVLDARIFQANLTLFERAGIAAADHLSQTWSWNELIDVGQRIAQPELGRHMLFIDLEFVLTYFLVHGEVISADFRSSRVDNSANAGILRLAQEAIHRYGISPPPSRQSNQTRTFNEGNLALRSVNVSAMQPQAVARNAGQWRFDWDVLPWPVSPYTQLRPALGEAQGLVVSFASRALPQAEAFLRVAISDEGQRAVAATGVGFPARIDLWEALPSSPGQPPRNREAFALAMQNWQHFFLPGTPDDLESLAMPIVAVLEGRLDAQTGLSQSHRLLDAALKEMIPE